MSVMQFAQAVHFAAQRHTAQRRKGGRQEPYINHLAEVAHLVAEATGGRDPELVVAAVLHDTLEDTPTTHDEIALHFGENVAMLVMEVTSDKSVTREERRRQDIAKIGMKSNRAKIIKLADKISNLRSLINDPPEEWTLDDCQSYVEFADELMKGLLGINRVLETEVKNTIQEARKSVSTKRLKRQG